MNDELMQRWRDGDAKAATAVRNAVRSVAERVLSHPALLAAAGPTSSARLRRDDLRRELTAQIAKEVLSRRADNATQLTAMALMVAGRHAVTALQENHPPTNDAHLPPPVAVTLALAPGGLVGRVREAADRHLEHCPHCKNDLRLLERVVAAHEAADPEGPEHEELVEEASRMDALFAEAEADLRGSLKREASAPAPARRPTRGSTRRVLPGNSPEKPRRPWVFAIPLVALVGVGVWVYQSGGGGALPGAPIPALSALADQTPPEVARISDLPPEVQFAVSDLAKGDCRTAAGRVRSARNKRPDEPRLFLIEGAAFVCAGDASKALGVFDDLDALLADAAPPRAVHWYRAQAHLLKGEGALAVALLELAITHDPKHREAAQAQLSRVRQMVSGG
jgi:glutaredoxin